MRPVRASHDLKLHVSNAGTPVAGVVITLAFDRNAVAHPLPPPVAWLPKETGKIAEAVLLHPMIAQPSFMKIFKQRKGEVVEREELIRILLEFAAKPDPAAPEQQKLRQILALDGLPDPARAIADIRAVAQRLELAEPQKAAHDRIAMAILTAARSSFVGRINNWFDQIMERTIVEYRFRAQIVTILGALLVATLVQLDSIDLLKRLSTDDKLRDSLVSQADQQQKNLDEQAKLAQHDQDEIQVARARREEIETNLAKLRDPQLGVLPDHFIWQPLPRARLMKNPDWVVPYSKRLELVAGAGVYPLEPRWSGDLLGDIETAIWNSGAPVTTKQETRTREKVTGPGIDGLQLEVGGADGLTHLNGFAEATVNPASVNAVGTFQFIVGYEPALTITATPAMNLRSAIEKSSAGVSTVNWPILRSVERGVRWIELRGRPNDPATNILLPVEIVDASAYFDDLLFADADRDGCNIVVNRDKAKTKCSVAGISSDLTNRGFKVAEADPVSDLLLTSHRLGALQLRSVPGKTDSNMLNSAPEPLPWISFDKDLLSTSWRGVLLTWVLLSLGAPFWYDALKDLLKLRSSLAKQEEDARSDRKSNSPPPAPAKK